MSPSLDTLFSLSSNLAIVGWLALALVPRRGEILYRVTGLLIPCLLAIIYGALMLTNFAGAEGGGYGSLVQVRALFSKDDILLAGWVHYLAFDLAVGTWIAKQAAIAGISHLIQIPILLLTLMFGPVGLLAFTLTRAGWSQLRPAKQELA
ncbi:MAG: ABA4-like family protein [Pseudomonadota bacterium]